MSAEETMQAWKSFMADLRGPTTFGGGVGGPENGAYLRATIHREDGTRSVLVVVPVQQDGQLRLEAKRFEEQGNDGEGQRAWLREHGINVG